MVGTVIPKIHYGYKAILNNEQNIYNPDYVMEVCVILHTLFNTEHIRENAKGISKSFEQ